MTTTRTGAAAFAGEFAVLVKGPEKIRIEFLAPGDQGKLLIVNGRDAWLVLPGTKNPIKVPRSHRVTGGFAVADVARTRFVDDYDATVEHLGRVDALIACAGHPGPVMPLAESPQGCSSKVPTLGGCHCSGRRVPVAA